MDIFIYITTMEINLALVNLDLINLKMWISYGPATLFPVVLFFAMEKISRVLIAASFGRANVETTQPSIDTGINKMG